MKVSRFRFPFALAPLAAALALCALTAQAEPSFLAVASGDMTASSAIVWTRATDGAGAATGLRLEVATDIGFGNVVSTVNNLSARDASYDFTLKYDLSGLSAGTTYFYRFSGSSAVSDIGRFVTAPSAAAKVPVKFSFSGDADGLMRPYTLVNNFQANTKRDFFIFLGDTIYEQASNGSPAAYVPPSLPLGTTLTSTQQAQIVSDYQKKYRENLYGVTAAGAITTSGQQGMKSLYAAQGNYTLLDNHELGNFQYINGGSPVAALSLGSTTNGSKLSDGFDVNTSNTYVNKTDGFKAFVKAYNSYQPTRETIISAPTDLRTDGTQQQYFVQNWGKNLSVVNLDDRSYRDIRLKKDNGTTDETPGSYVTNAGTTSGTPSNRWALPGRTMLGSTQLSWAQQSLLAQQAAGQVWKVVAVSSPIDQAGSDGGKSWFGGYQAERDSLLKFIDDNGIQNVVFLSTDDHRTRINELYYKDGNTVKRSSAFTIVTGPLGATGPDVFASNHLYTNAVSYTAAATARLTAENTAMFGGAAGNQFGLKDFGSRVTNIKRDVEGVLKDGSFAAGGDFDPVNFFSLDTFAYTNLDVSADGVLSVTVWGIDSYASNTFPTNSPVPRVIMSFDVTAVPEPSGWALMLGGGVLLVALRRRRVTARAVAEATA